MILFFDENCPFCRRAVLFILNRDHNKGLFFAPLGGQTAEEKLAKWRKTHKNVDSLILIEGSEITYNSKALFRVCRHMGGWLKNFGFLAYLPSWLLFPFDMGYRLVASCRHRLCAVSIDEKRAPWNKQYKERFLP
ncbi:MAG: hypothetical protein JWO53_713 [Chlamydiia bacterium]|nr:hypothetical protein [Chlamydiia bacterium]